MWSYTFNTTRVTGFRSFLFPTSILEILVCLKALSLGHFPFWFTLMIYLTVFQIQNAYCTSMILLYLPHIKTSLINKLNADLENILRCTCGANMLSINATETKFSLILFTSVKHYIYSTRHSESLPHSCKFLIILPWYFTRLSFEIPKPYRSY